MYSINCNPKGAAFAQSTHGLSTGSFICRHKIVTNVQPPSVVPWVKVNRSLSFSYLFRIQIIQTNFMDTIIR